MARTLPGLTPRSAALAAVLLALTIATGTLTGCGLKGALYLPQQKKSKVPDTPNNPTPDTPSDATPAPTQGPASDGSSSSGAAATDGGSSSNPTPRT